MKAHTFEDQANFNGTKRDYRSKEIQTVLPRRRNQGNEHFGSEVLGYQK